MDVIRVISELLAERKRIDRAILSLEGFDRRNIGATKAKLPSVTEIRRVMRPGDNSLRASAGVGATGRDTTSGAAA